MAADGEKRDRKSSRERERHTHMHPWKMFLASLIQSIRVCVGVNERNLRTLVLGNLFLSDRSRHFVVEIFKRLEHHYDYSPKCRETPEKSLFYNINITLVTGV